MKITRPGRYRVLSPVTTCDYDCFHVLRPGDVIEIERIDPSSGDVWGEGLCDWHDAEIPVAHVEDKGQANQTSHEEGRA